MALYYVTVAFHVEAGDQEGAIEVGNQLGWDAVEFSLEGEAVRFTGNVEAENVDALLAELRAGGEE